MRRCRPASEAGPRASRPRGSRAGSPLHRGRRGHAPGRAAAPPSPRPPCRHARVVSEQKPVPAAQSRGCVWLTTAGEETAHRPRTHPAERPARVGWRTEGARPPATGNARLFLLWGHRGRGEGIDTRAHCGGRGGRARGRAPCRPQVTGAPVAAPGVHAAWAVPMARAHHGPSPGSSRGTCLTKFFCENKQTCFCSSRKLNVKEQAPPTVQTGRVTCVIPRTTPASGQ